MKEPFETWRRDPGDASFAELVATCEGMVRQAARRQFPGDAAVQDEVVQAVFWVLHRRGRRVRHAGVLPAWLLTVTRRVAGHR